MDEYSGQKPAGGLALSRRGSSLSFRDSNHVDKNIQYCNRLGCSTRPNYVKGTNTINQEKAKYSKPSRSTSSKVTVGSSSSCKTSVESSSKSLAGMNNLRKPRHQEQHNPTLLKETIISENRSIEGEVEAIEPVPSTTEIQARRMEPENREAVVCHGLSTNSTEEASNTRPQKRSQQFALTNQETSMGSSNPRSLSSRNSNQTPTKSQGQGANTRYGLRNIGCASISDIFPSSSLSDYSRRRIDMIKRRCPPDEESRAARGKKTGGSSSGASSQRNAFSSTNPSSTDHLTLQPTSRRSRNWSAGSSSVASVRTRRTISGDTSMMFSNSESDNVASMPERIMIPRSTQAEFSINESAMGGVSFSFPTEIPSVSQNSFRRSGSSNETARSRPIIRPQDNSTRPLHSFSSDRDGFRRFNMEGIAEVLLALERIEQDEELTYEQLLALESNLLLGGLSFHDQHRDMRLDIDNMSYEELLALEEKMGTVSTALSEEELSKCLRRSCYVTVPTGFVCNGNDDIKCSICQEEYVVGDEVGKLGCEHRYHVECIHQWLQQKNWCPICKASAAPSWSSSVPAACGANHFV